MPSKSEVVITGMGAVTPIGIGTPAMWESLSSGTSGIASFQEYDLPGYPVTFGGEVKNFEGKQYVKPRKALKVMCREIQTGFSAAALAMDQAGLQPGSVEPERLGVVYGSEMMYSDFGDLRAAYDQCIEEGWYEHDRWGPSAMSETNPLWMLKYLPNMPACHVGIYYDGRAHNNTHCLEDVSSIYAISEGAAHVRSGLIDCMITGGTGSRLNINVLLYRGDILLSHRNDDPAAASRPFEKNRDGIVSSEGSASLVLESRQHSEARGANIVGQIQGWASTFGKVTRQQSINIQAVRNSIRVALADAGITASDLAFVSAHGTSHPEDDICEAEAISAELPGVPVVAFKSYYGHAGAACGALDVVSAALALQHQTCPVTLNYETPDAACDLPVIHGEPRSLDKPYALVINQARTGQCAALVISREW